MLQIHYKNTSKSALWLVEPKYTIGSDNTNPIQTGVGPAHIVDMLVSADGIALVNLAAGVELRINDKRVPLLTEQNARLMHGDEFSLADLILEVIDPKLLKAQEQSVSVAHGVATGWSLRALNHALAVIHFPLSGTLIFGRSKECDVCFSVDHLSRQHARIIVTKNGLIVEDLNSSNGTFVNGKRINRVTLNNGDTLSFDTLDFQVCGPVVSQEEDLDRTEIRSKEPSFEAKHRSSHVKPLPAKHQKSKPDALLRTGLGMATSNTVMSAAITNNASYVKLGIIVGVIALMFAITFLMLRG